jgi:hypothetical protein
LDRIRLGAFELNLKCLNSFEPRCLALCCPGPPIGALSSPGLSLPLSPTPHHCQRASMCPDPACQPRHPHPFALPCAPAHLRRARELLPPTALPGAIPTMHRPLRTPSLHVSPRETGHPLSLYLSPTRHRAAKRGTDRRPIPLSPPFLFCLSLSTPTPSSLVGNTPHRT